MDKSITWIVVAVVIVVTLGVAVLMMSVTPPPTPTPEPPASLQGGSPTPTPTPAPQPSTTPPPTPTPPPSSGTQTEKKFTVTGQSFSFVPGVIRVKQGEKVTITFKNTEGFHDWRIDEFSAFTNQISAGAEQTISFTADKKGSFEYYCSVGNHRALGMKGTLIVE